MNNLKLKSRSIAITMTLLSLALTGCMGTEEERRFLNSQLIAEISASGGSTTLLASLIFPIAQMSTPESSTSSVMMLALSPAWKETGRK